MFMIPLIKALALAAVLSHANAWQAPAYSGFTRVWQSTMYSPSGSANQPNTGQWNMIDTDDVYNNEVQTYTSSTSNLIFNHDDQTLQILPRHTSSGWTSGRIESKYTFTPATGKVTRVEASLRLAGNPAVHKQGIWPAFWMLGDSYRHGTLWPACGEIDIMENINGQKYASGAAHCDSAPGGLCNEYSGLVAGTTLPDNKYHVWRVEFDRLSHSYSKQVIRWYMDGELFHELSGLDIGNSKVWKTLCQAPLYFILNIAIGGDWVSLMNLCLIN